MMVIVIVKILRRIIIVIILKIIFERTERNEQGARRSKQNEDFVHLDHEDNH